MKGPTSGPLAIIVAMTEPATPAFFVRLERFAEEAGPLGEVIVVDGSGTPGVEDLTRNFTNVRVLSRPPGRLAPLLWRDGLIATDLPLIAFTNFQMLVCRGWRDALVDRLRESNVAGVGGPIEPGPLLSKTDRAVALLRYSSYFPPLPASAKAEPPGDNALYRRECLEGVEDSWIDGFWEVEVHRALRVRGETLAMADRAIATFEGGSRLLAMAGQRVRHARRYAAGRSVGLTRFARLLRVVVSPMVPPLLCGRIVQHLHSRGMSLAPWIKSLPGLMLLASAWAFGEVVGSWQGSSPGPDDPGREPVTQLT
jgi:hypothetical protein